MRISKRGVELTRLWRAKMVELGITGTTDEELRPLLPFVPKDMIAVSTRMALAEGRDPERTLFVTIRLALELDAEERARFPN